MRKFAYIFLLLTCSTAVFSQKLTDKKFQITRIPLAEKFNLPARNLPRLLIKAYCEGKIQAYYPLRLKNQCSYHEFIAHFNLNKPQPVPGQNAETTLCPNAFCSTGNDGGMLDPFCFYYDIVEEKGTTAQVKHNIKYIRLVYAKEKHDATAYYDGPVFRYADVESLTEKEYTLLNPKNQSASMSFKQYFEAKVFTGFILDPSGTPKKVNKTNEPDKHHH